MPELPEVETLKRQLNQTLPGKILQKIEILRDKSFQGDTESLIGETIKGISRKAKILQIDLDTSFPKLLIHLKMTGQLIHWDKKQNQKIVGGHPTLDWITELPSSHTRVIFTFQDNSILFFNDMRVFGWIKVINDKKRLEKEMQSFSSVEPLTKSFTPQWLETQLQKSGRAIKIAIMDQKILAGVGNIYANDALFLSRILPNRVAKSLTKKEIIELHTAINIVIKKGIQYGGATESTYRQLDGLGGTYQEHFLTYKRDGQPCLECGGRIKKMKVGGRGTFFCPQCQQ